MGSRMLAYSKGVQPPMIDNEKAGPEAVLRILPVAKRARSLKQSSEITVKGKKDE